MGRLGEEEGDVGGCEGVRVLGIVVEVSVEGRALERCIDVFGWLLAAWILHSVMGLQKRS